MRSVLPALRCGSRVAARPSRVRWAGGVQASAHASASASASAPRRPSSSSSHRPPPPDPLTRPPPPLDAAALASTAVLARAAGAAYAYDDASAAARLAPDGLSLTSAGETWFTRWLVIDAPPSAHRPASRIISLRGVVWGREGPLDGWRLGRSLAQAWPSALTPVGGGLPVPGVVAHTGAAALAEELWHHIRPAVRSAPRGAEVTLVGHSLGGALALLAAAAAAASSSARERPLGVTQFGAPPVLASGGGGGGPAVLTATGLIHAPVRSFVAAGDPVPRAGLAAADPAVAAAAAAWAPVASAARALGLGAWLDGGSGGGGGGGGAGSSTATADRPGTSFLPAGYDPVGDTYLVSWTPDAGHAVRPLAPADVSAALVAAAPETVASVAAAAASAAAENAPTNPLSVPAAARRALGAWLDHAHTSYADDLAAAAVAAAKVEKATGAGGAAGRKKRSGSL